jgi:hypothetical protein
VLTEDEKSWRPFVLSLMTDVASRLLSERFALLSPGQKAEVRKLPSLALAWLFAHVVSCSCARRAGLQAICAVCVLFVAVTAL